MSAPFNHDERRKSNLPTKLEFSGVDSRIQRRKATGK